MIQEILADHIISVSGIQFPNIVENDGNVHMTIPFGKPSHENELSIHVNEDSVEVGVYDQFDEISIFRTTHANVSTIIAIAKHIYNTNRY